jgi:hypothetical protein
MVMARCKACDSEYGVYISEWDETYCRECEEAILDVISEDEEDLDDLSYLWNPMETNP